VQNSGLSNFCRPTKRAFVIYGHSQPKQVNGFPSPGYVSYTASDSYQQRSYHPYSWDKATRRELVELYFDGMDVEMLGWHFEMKAFEVYRELISLLLGVKHLNEDPSVPRFRKRWEYLEDSELIRLYRDQPISKRNGKSNSDSPRRQRSYPAR